MDVEKVEVFKTPVCKLFFAYGLDLMAFMEAVPELACYKKIFPLDQTFFDCSSNSLTRFDFIAIVCRTISYIAIIEKYLLLTASSIKKSISRLDSIIHRICTCSIIDFPETEADLGHFITTVKLD